MLISFALWLAAVGDPSGVSAWGGRREQSINSSGGNGMVPSQLQDHWAWLMFQLTLSLVGTFLGAPEILQSKARMVPDMGDILP